MKKTLITIGLVLVLAMAVSAQEEEGVGLTGKGFKVGFFGANIGGSDGGGSSMKMGFGGGVFLTYSFSPTFAIQPEVMYAMHGFKVSIFGLDIKQKLDYIDIPILLKYQMATEGNFKPNFFVGPVVGMLMSASLEGVDDKEIYKSVNMGVTAGAGATMQMESMALTFDVRYMMGLTSIAEDDPDGTTYDVKTQDIIAMVGLSF